MASSSGPGPVSDIPNTSQKTDTSNRSNIPTQLIIWGMVGFILVELIAILCLVRYCCRARYVKKRKFKEREIILSNQTDLYYAGGGKSAYADVKSEPLNNTVMVDDMHSVYSTSKPKLSTFELHLNIEKPPPRPEQQYTMRYSTTAPKPIEQTTYSYDGSLNRPVFEIMSHADQRPATPIRYETVKEFSLEKPNRNISKKYTGSLTQPIGRVNFAYENNFMESGERVEWQTTNEIKTVDWDGLRKITTSDNDWNYEPKYDWKRELNYSSLNDSYLNAYERLLASNIRTKAFVDRPEFHKINENDLTERDFIKRVIKDPDTDEILAVRRERSPNRSNVSIIDVKYEEKEAVEVAEFPPPVQFQQSAKRDSIESKETRSRFSSLNKKHESEAFLSSHEINIQTDAISIGTNNQLDSPDDINDYIKKLDKLEPQADKLNFSELNKNFLDENEVNESKELVETDRETGIPIAPPLPDSSPIIVRKKISEEDRQSVASSMNKSSAHLY
ncbi:hypothetical protein BpHYR1_024069 [Brachionus plicatilis]|uniref:Uncharacterized protein n=1 Tax=Brachionus plicatilis TaxID=10195 RepID=A0A3M7P5X5_BRAPC|nr:hypothetical protein BpHYR1_024069 [Brachionus plicatilis]